MKYQLGAALVGLACVTSHVSVLCVSRICAQLCYQLNLQRGKWWPHPQHGQRPQVPGHGPSSWAGAALG